MYYKTNLGIFHSDEYANLQHIVTEAEEITDAEYAELIKPADVVPPQISPRQIRMALTQMNLRTQVEAAVAAGSQDLKDFYEFSTVFERSHPQVIAMAAALNVTDAELDALWKLGGTL